MCDSLLFSKNNPIEETHQHDHYIIYCNHYSDCYSYIINSLRQISPSSLKYNRKTLSNPFHISRLLLNGTWPYMSGETSSLL